MEQSNLQGAELSGNVLFYKQPEPLSTQLHASLGVNRTSKPYRFVAAANLVPLTVAEFVPAALSYPVVFLGEGKVPLAVMGLREGENLFVNADGDFRVDAYIPSFVRRYPFVFAAEQAGDRLVLCIDRAAPFVAENAEVPFFENGQPSSYTQTAMQFCNDFETERRRTEQFISMLSELDLFETREATFQPMNVDGTPAAPVKLADYFAVSLEKLNKLPNEKFLELRDNGALGQIYAHLFSLLAWDKLVALAVERQNADQPTMGNA